MYLAVLSTLVAVAAAQSPVGIGSTEPISSAPQDVCTRDARSLVADQRSVCWYYQCVPNAGGGLSLRPRRCATGTYVSSNFVSGLFNPCIERFPIMGVYDCNRGNAPTIQSCLSTLNCKNGGQPLQEGSLCWCNCSAEFQGSSDCSVPKGSTPVPPTDYPCPLGQPLDNWCAKALPNAANPCQNGGICVNQCFNFYCNCSTPFTRDKLCGAFDCSQPPNTCPGTQKCQRGVNGRDEIYTCV